jgi:hypothetical protein
MMTVRELCSTLAALAPETQVGLLTLSRVGICVDEVTTTCASVQPSVGDDGTIQFVWLIGAEPAPCDAPAIVSWPCSCGELVVAIPNEQWADDVHPDHHDDPTFTPPSQ